MSPIRHYVILSGTVADVQPYCSGTVDWMIQTLPTLFGHQVRGRLMRNVDETTEYWEGRVWEQERWEDVSIGDAFEVKVYEFVPDGGGFVDLALRWCTYTVYSFVSENYRFYDINTRADIHGSPFIPPSGPLAVPPFVFDWHFLQCIFTRFGTDQTKEPNHTHLIAKHGQVNHSSNDGEGGPELPSARFDRVYASIADIARRQHQAQHVDEWRHSVVGE
ncbi:Ras-related GTP-binding protein D [Pseudohyphozyma bogoriensis]|nr:Ras-related GTP-binding protein D [Pseudohyphozyma bogoriensis]